MTVLDTLRTAMLADAVTTVFRNSDPTDVVAHTKMGRALSVRDILSAIFDDGEADHDAAVGLAEDCLHVIEHRQRRLASLEPR